MKSPWKVTRQIPSWFRCRQRIRMGSRRERKALGRAVGPLRHVGFLPLEMGKLQGRVSVDFFFGIWRHISTDLSGKHIKKNLWHLMFMGSFQAVTTGFFPIFFWTPQVFHPICWSWSASSHAGLVFFRCFFWLITEPWTKYPGELIAKIRGFHPTWFTGDYFLTHRIGKPFSTNKRISWDGKTGYFVHGSSEGHF